MRSGFGTFLAVVVVAALAGIPAVHASDERHSRRVGSVSPAGSRVRGFASSGGAGALQAQPAEIQAARGLWIPPAPRAPEPPTHEPPTKNSQPKADPLSDGIGIGAAVGAGVSLGLVGWAYAQCDDTCDAPEPGGMYALGAGMGAAIGAAVGLVIDAARKNTNQRVSIAGSVAPARSQVRVTVRW